MINQNPKKSGSSNVNHLPYIPIIDNFSPPKMEENKQISYNLRKFLEGFSEFEQTTIRESFAYETSKFFPECENLDVDKFCSMMQIYQRGFDVKIVDGDSFGYHAHIHRNRSEAPLGHLYVTYNPQGEKGISISFAFWDKNEAEAFLNSDS